MSKSKNLSNPFSTGGGGFHFEAHVQASFVTLMLSGGHAPCLPCWPIVEIKLQGKIDGFETDDLVVFVEDTISKERRKLLGQVKHSIPITQGSSLFGEVMQAAWNDFNNCAVFTRNKDVIALITGPINATDAHNAQWLLNQARHTKNVDEFFRRVYQEKFSPPQSAKKLEVIQHRLKEANGGIDVPKDKLYDFLKHFHLLGYDLGNDFGVVLSLLHSHISQFQQHHPQWAWSRIVDIVQTWNQDAGTITPGKLPDDILEAFKQKAVTEMPKEFKAIPNSPKTDWSQHSDATYLALAILIGSWNEKSECDLESITQLLGISYDEWLTKARDILHYSDSPLSLKNGVWKVNNRTELWDLLGSRILDQNLDTFRSLAVSILQEPDPAFELPVDERYAASIHGKVLKRSHMLREGIAEGLAILGSLPDGCSNCSLGKAESTSARVIRQLLTGSDWVLWGSLNGLLPTLAEAAPDEFLNAVEDALHLTPCPFDELFSQEGDGFTGGNYLTGLLWALEGLAWDEQFLVRVCVVLGELASHDPGGRLANRPSNSLATILLPWFPQTLASVDKRKVAVQTLLNERPEIAWNLIIQLLPDQHRISTGSHKPSWRKTIPDGREESVTSQEYWQQVSIYGELAVATAGTDADRLSVLIDHFDHLPRPAFDQLIEVLASQTISELPEEQRLSLWEHLTKLTHQHRRFSDAQWALSDELITRIEQVAKQLTPTNPFNLYQHLFEFSDSHLYDENGDWEEQRKKIDTRREKAISEIFQQSGIKGVIRFSEAVYSSSQVGNALGIINDPSIELDLLPRFLDTPNKKLKALANGFICKRHHILGWEWCDSIDKSNWTPTQAGQFLTCLPFSKETWNRVSDWLQMHEDEYWTHASANVYQTEGDLPIAIEKLMEHDRPHAAINCLYRMRRTKQAIDTSQCVRALLKALSSSEPSYAMDGHHIVELIKFLQTEPSVNQDDLFRVEWAYVPLLYSPGGAAPRLLENRLANDPNFFCEVIRLIYRSKKEDKPSKEPTEESKAIAKNAWRLLHEWTIPPSTQNDGTFCEKRFTEWLQIVKDACLESGHLEVALANIGEVLIHAPSDPTGLWIHRAVAAALNHRDADPLRDGFRTGLYNSRGVHQVDPTGEPEKELASGYALKAEEVENAGFQRLALTLRNLASAYEREAELIRSEHQPEA